ncbi:LapA family protein [bacterium]|nr:LapA family protein [bacterium]
MRALSFLFLVAFAAAIGYFAYTNDRTVSVNLAGRLVEVSVPVLAGAVYLLGMFTGWAVVGVLRRSWRRVAEYDRR